MDGRMNEQVGRQINRQIFKWNNMHSKTDQIQINRYVDGQKNNQIGRQVGREIERKICNMWVCVCDGK